MTPQSLNPWRAPTPGAAFDIAKLLKQFETSAKAKSERDVRVASLRRRGSAEHDRLANQLSSCLPGARCASAACPICYRRFRKWVAGEMLRAFGTEPALLAATLIPAGWAVPVDRLSEFSPRSGSDAFRQQLRRAGAGNAVVLGGIDGDYDEANRVWRPHLHLIVAADLAPTLRDISRRLYPNSDSVYRPCVIQAVADAPAQISYCFKSFWSEKVRFVDRRGQGRIIPRRLSEPLHADWLVWRAGYSFTDMVFAQGVRRVGGEYRRIASRDS